jgi:hypothetical protein
MRAGGRNVREREEGGEEKEKERGRGREEGGEREREGGTGRVTYLPGDRYLTKLSYTSSVIIL